MSDLTHMAATQLDATTMMRYDANKRSAGVAYLLWFFLGALGVHRFYLRRKGSAVAMLCITLVAAVLYGIAAGVAAGARAGGGAHNEFGAATSPDAASALGAAGMLAILGVIAYAVIGIWWIVDAFLLPSMTRGYNNGLIAQLSGPGAVQVGR